MSSNPDAWRSIQDLPTRESFREFSEAVVGINNTLSSLVAISSQVAQALGVSAAAGSTGLAADAGHVHPFPTQWPVPENFQQDVTVNKRLFVSPGGPTSVTNNGMLNGDILADRGDGTGVIFFGQHASGQGKYLYWNGTKYVLGDQDQILQTSQVLQSAPSVQKSYSAASVSGSFGGDLNWYAGPAVTLTGTWLVHAFATANTTSNADTIQLGIFDVTSSAILAYGPAVATPSIGASVTLVVPPLLLTLSNHTLCLSIRRNGASTPNFGPGTPPATNMQSALHGIYALQIG